eukprot:366367-Chlamydomonas_euryale.AAC.16
MCICPAQALSLRVCEARQQHGPSESTGCLEGLCPDPMHVWWHRSLALEPGSRSSLPDQERFRLNPRPDQGALL